MVADGFFHVRLAGGEPDFTDQNVRVDFCFTGFHDQILRFGGGLELSELHQPSAVRASVRGFCLPGEFHGHDCIRGGPAPDRNRLLSLQHHVVAEDGGQSQGAGIGRRDFIRGPDRLRIENQNGGGNGRSQFEQEAFHGSILENHPCKAMIIDPPSVARVTEPGANRNVAGRWRRGRW